MLLVGIEELLSLLVGADGEADVVAVLEEDIEDVVCDVSVSAGSFTTCSSRDHVLAMKPEAPVRRTRVIMDEVFV